MGLIYAVIAVVIFFALILTIILLAKASDTPKETTTAFETESETTSAETTTAEATTTQPSGTTYPPATVPPASSGKTDTPTLRGEIPPLDAAMEARLMEQKNDLRGWGPGSEGDEKNRPLYAITAQKNYGTKFGSSYLMDDDKIYLTFDEGYENGYTEKILDVLKEKNVKAVFFVTLPYAKDEPELVQRMIDEGHIVGNHSTAHLSFPSMTLEEAYEDIKTLHDYMIEHFDYEMTLFRFPMGESSDRTQALLQEMGYTSVFWSFAYRDWETDNQPEREEALQTITERAHPGAVYLLHAVSKTNTELLPEIIDYFRAEGYTIARYPVK